MRFIAVCIVTLLITQVVGLSFNNAIAAPAKKHSHNGRVHSHILPATGVKHFHKHMHNGRAHIHPYSAKVGFKHSHNLNPRAKAWENAVKHKHGDRSHSHPLPRTGIKHQHRHKHGGRTHIHPFPVIGVKHFHQVNKTKPSSKPVVTKNKQPFIINDLSIEQIGAVLNTPLRDTPITKPSQNKPTPTIKPQKTINLRDKKYLALLKNKVESVRPTLTPTPQRKIPIINKNIINKVLAYGYHQHDGRAHQHPLPASGTRHAHKHAHKGRVHSHLIPISKTVHTHEKTVNVGIVKSTKKVLPKKKKKRLTPVKTVNKSRANTRKVAVRKKRQRAVKKSLKPIPIPATQTPQQIAEGNRQFTLALRYEHGTGVKKNLPQAINWYLRAAKNNNAKAQFNLASLYENGEGVSRNIPQAIRWYYAAANNGDVNAQVNLGNKYARGNNVPKNTNKAAYWYKRAADQGDMRGCANLNYLIKSNNGVIK